VGTILVPATIFTPPGLHPWFILKSYLFVPARHPFDGDILPAYTLGWTLNYEMFFYLIFGLALFSRRMIPRLACLGAAFTALTVCGAIAQPSGPAWSTYTSPLLLEFAAGVALAVARQSLTSRLGATAGTMFIAAAVGWLGVVFMHGAPLGRVIAYGVPASLIVAGATMLEPLARQRISPAFLLLGNASYSIYLAHPFGQRAWFTFARHFLAGPANSFAQISIIVAGELLFGIAAGIVSWFVVERPLLAAGRRLIPRRKRIPSAIPVVTPATSLSGRA
jgi:exopolysaccharide production protein ExoZ